MPLSRTVNGFKHEWPLDSLSEGLGLPLGHYTIDTEEKKEGDGSLKYDDPDFSFGAYFQLNNKAGMAVAGDRVHIWHKAATANHTWQLKVSCFGKGGCLQGDLPYWTTVVIAKTGSEGWTLKKGDLPSNVADGENLYVYPSVLIASNYITVTDYVDRLVISSSRYLTVTGLTPGQKVEVYRTSDDVKIAEPTCAEGETQVIIDIDDQDYPFYLYFKVYATDSVTLIEITANHRMCGGDTWYWVPPYGTLTIESSAFIIIRSDGTGTPKEANITATLKTPAGAPAPNKTIYFTTGKGNVTPSSDVTDENGEAQTVLTSDVHGIAVVKANWPGDADIPAAVGWATHHVFYNAEVGDENKKFQFYLEGIEYSYVKGSYSLASVSEAQEFNVEIPEWLSTITRRGLVSIYRKGVKEYGGIMTKPHRLMSDSPNQVLSGTDSKSLLETRVVTLKDYSAKSLSYILEDLFDTYPCGVTVGAVGEYPTALTITFADETLVSTVSRLCVVIGWLYRVKTDNSLDVKESFGSSKPFISFVQGVNLFLAGNDEDYVSLANSLRMRGAETLVSTAVDGASIEALGLVEDVAFQKSIGVQSTLDIAAAAELARRVSGAIMIGGAVLDDYDMGSWGVDDWVTLTCNDVELSGTYKVVKITRDMTDPRYASVDFANKAAVELGDLFDRLKRELKDLSAKTTI